MALKSGILAAGVLMVAVVLSSDSAAWAQQTSQAQPAVPGPGCDFGEVIDDSTADDAHRTIEAAAFSDVPVLKKSCDNFWYGKATLAGRPVNVALSPSGEVMLESD
jgi:hypothetical protein